VRSERLRGSPFEAALRAERAARRRAAALREAKEAKAEAKARARAEGKPKGTDGKESLVIEGPAKADGKADGRADGRAGKNQGAPGEAEEKAGDNADGAAGVAYSKADTAGASGGEPLSPGRAPGAVGAPKKAKWSIAAGVEEDLDGEPAVVALTSLLVAERAAELVRLAQCCLGDDFARQHFLQHRVWESAKWKGVVPDASEER